jgi:hypothetical protein
MSSVGRHNPSLASPRIAGYGDRRVSAQLFDASCSRSRLRLAGAGQRSNNGLMNRHRGLIERPFGSIRSHAGSQGPHGVSHRTECTGRREKRRLTVERIKDGEAALVSLSRAWLKCSMRSQAICPVFSTSSLTGDAILSLDPCGRTYRAVVRSLRRYKTLASSFHRALSVPPPLRALYQPPQGAC